MSDDELLASAFRKILRHSDERYHSVSVSLGGELGRPSVILDSTWTEDDGLTRAELEAIARASSSECPCR